MKIQSEKFIDIINEIKPLFPLHYEELAMNKESVPLDPDYELYFRIDDLDLLCLITVRDDDDIICGYYFGIVSPGMHYKSCLTCITDMFYIAEEYRGAGTATKLFNFVKADLRSRGVKRWICGTKWHKDASVFLEKQGFEKTEILYSRLL